MILTILIGVWLVVAVVRGWQKGLLATVITLVSGVIVWTAAFQLHRDLAAKLAGTGSVTLGTLLLAFTLILLVGYLIVHVLLMVAQAIKWVPVVKQANSLGGALLSGAFNYLLVFVALALALMLDTPWVQQQFDASPTAQAIVTKTPLLTTNAIQNWLDADATTQTQTATASQPANQASSSSTAATSSSQDVNAAPTPQSGEQQSSWWDRIRDWFRRL